MSAGGRLAAFKNNMLAFVALAGAFGICVLAAKAYWKDLACRDAAAVEACKAELGNPAPVAPKRAPKKIYIAAGLLPPNFKEDRSGREAEIIATALETGDGRKVAPEQIQFVVEPFARHWYSYQADRRFDAVATVPRFMDLEGYKSDYYIMYRNGIGTLPAPPSAHSPVDLAHLRGKRVVAFAGAPRVIPELKSLPEDYFALFVERQDQREHSLMLLRGKVDAVIADAMIFAYFNDRLLKDGTVRRQLPPVFTDAFAPTCYTMVFRDAAYRDLFDSGLKKMIASGKLKEIDDRYIRSSNLSADIHYVGESGAPRCPD